MSQRFQPENLLRLAQCYHMIVVGKSELERYRSVTDLLLRNPDTKDVFVVMFQQKIVSVGNLMI